MQDYDVLRHTCDSLKFGNLTACVFLVSLAFRGVHGGGAAPCRRAWLLADTMSRSGATPLKTVNPLVSDCTITGYDQTFGRLVNCIPEDQVCTTGLATGELPSGYFLFVLQTLSLRKKDSLPGPTTWINPLKAVFPAQCAAGWVANSTTGMCAGPLLPTTSPSPVPARSPSAGTLDCVSGRTTLAAIAECYQSSYMPKASFSSAQYPNSNEVADLRAAMRALLNNNGNCRRVQLGSSIAAHMAVYLFVDSKYGTQYCVLIDVSDADGNNKYDKGFGLVVVADRRVDIHRYLVHMASHPQSETDTERQALLLLAETGGQVAVVSGVRRDVATDFSTCQTQYNSMDSAYNVKSAMYILVLEIWKWYKVQTL
eukprot:g58601.t1